VTIRPIFILSAPRSGSTLLQRVLAAHAGVATAAEPWILLPLLTPLRGDMPGTSQRDQLVHEAVSDFVSALPQGRADYLAAVRETALKLYATAAGPDARFFVDKSPTYHLVVEELFEAFPEGRFVFLWRNPLAVMASAVELFDQGRWEVNRYTLALFQSIEDLVPASRRHADASYTVRFEELVSGDQEVWRGLSDYVGLEHDPFVLERFSNVKLNGRMGDPTGTRLYSKLASEPIDKWRDVVSTPVRRLWARRYLQWIGTDRLAHMGYDLDALQAELDAVEVSLDGAGDDLGRLMGSLARDAVKAVVPPHVGDRGVWSRLAGRRGSRRP
jgi:hypothetical protein